MNMVLTFLAKNWQRLSLRQFGTPASLSSVILTPRFQASSHIIAFIWTKSPHPVLVAKIPRIKGDNQRLDHEVSILRRVQAARSNGFDSIPRVIVNEDWHGHRLMIETMVAGMTMKPAIVRRQPSKCLDAVMSWLLDLELATIKQNTKDTNWFTRLAMQPLSYFEKTLPQLSVENDLIDRTKSLVSPLNEADIPLVFEHGDLSSPNILMDEKDRIGVVDWELAEPKGLPAADLFFFLTYVAFARNKATKLNDQLQAFHKAFFGENAWAQPHVLYYADRFQLSPQLLKPLFILSWGRYVSNMVSRLENISNSSADFAQETAPWLRKNRYFAIWNHSIKHLDQLSF